MQRTIGLLSSVLVLGLACAGDDSSGDTENGSSDSTAGDTTAAMTTMSMTTADDTTGDGSGSGGGSGDSSSGGGDATSTGAATDGADSSTGDPTSGSDSSGGGGEAAYPACQPDADPVCPKPYELCWPEGGPGGGGNNFCTIECESPDDCPQPTSGEAVPVCEGPPGTDVCILDCSKGACPDDMECVDVFDNGMFLRCIYPT